MIDRLLVASELERIGFKKSKDEEGLFIYDKYSIFVAESTIYILKGTSIRDSNYSVIHRIEEGEIETVDMNEFRKKVYDILSTRITINGKNLLSLHYRKNYGQSGHN